jgi:hypothetical protein
MLPSTRPPCNSALIDYEREGGHSNGVYPFPLRSVGGRLFPASSTSASTQITSDS